MKNIFLKTQKKTKNSTYKLQDSVKSINKNYPEISVSISGEFCCNPIKFIRKKLMNSDFEMF